MERLPAVAGQFYPAGKEELQELIDGLLKTAGKKKVGNVKGIVVPHAGLVYSGLTAAFAYNIVPKETRKIVLIGPSHHAGFDGMVSSTAEYWKTPLGKVKLAKAKQSDWVFPSDEAHENEHNLEVQLPFLQTVLKNFEILPLLFGSVPIEEAALVLEENLKDAFLVVSTDLSHYHDYETAKKLDAETVEGVLKLDLKKVVEGEACGKPPLLAAVRLCQLKKWKPVLLDARNSGDTAGDKRNVVGYASFAFV
jgi:hypothetical protein